MPVTRLPVRLATRSALRCPLSAVYSAAAEPTPPGSPSAWHTAYNTTYMTVNSDGTGGAPAIGTKVGRLLDRTGNGNHILQATAANRLLAQSGYMSCPSSSFDGNRRYMQAAAGVSGATTQSVTGLFVIDTNEWPSDLIPFTYSGGSEATRSSYRAKWTAVAYRGSATALEFWINGTQVNTRAAIASTAIGAQFIGATAGNPGRLFRFYESVVYNTALNDADFALLRAYGATRSASGLLGTGRLIFMGDSLSYGTCSAAASSSVLSNTSLPSYQRISVAVAGGTITSPFVDVRTALETYRGSGRTLCVFGLGSNDISVLGKTGAQTEAIVATYCRSLRQAGYKMILWTLPDRTGSTSVINDYNTLIRANAVGDYADAIADHAATTELQNAANATYFPDGTHLSDASNALVDPVHSAAIHKVEADWTASALTGLAGANITFTDQTIESPTAWDWKVNGVTASTVQNPVINFPSAGTFDIQLDATNANGVASCKRSGHIVIVSALAPVTTGVALWLKKGDASGATWTDSSGSARDLTLFNAPTISGGTVLFNGSTQYGKTAAFSVSQPRTTYIRMRAVAWTSGGRIIDGDTTNANLLYMTGASPGIQLYPGGAGGTRNTGLVVGSWQTIVFGRKQNANELFTEISGTLGSDYDVGSTSDGFTLARAGGGGNFANIEVAEVLIVGAYHTLQQRAQTVAYMDSL